MELVFELVMCCRSKLSAITSAKCQSIFRRAYDRPLGVYTKLDFFRFDEEVTTLSVIIFSTRRHERPTLTSAEVRDSPPNSAKLSFLSLHAL
jgi:hypothetical protein